MQQVTNQQRLKPWMGFVLFAVVMALFIFVCVPMQAASGTWGLVGTELLFLVLAVVFGLVFKIPLKEMFPIKKFTARDFFGSLLLLMGGTSFGAMSVGLLSVFVPSTLDGGDVEALTDLIISGPGYILTMLMMAVLPAICEEAIHRGAILTCFRTIKKDWVIVLIMAIFFGINHMSALRFINTAILGACLSYIVVKKNNILLSSMMHFLLNFSASTVSYLSTLLLSQTTGSQVTGSDISATLQSGALKSAIGTYFMMGVAAPFMIVIGLMLLNPAGHKKIRFLFAAIIAVVCFCASIGFTAYFAATSTVASSSFSFTNIEENAASPAVNFEVKEEGRYTIICVLMNGNGDYTARVTDDQGKVVSEQAFPTGTIRTYNATLELEPGNYHFSVINGRHTLGESPSFSVQVNKT